MKALILGDVSPTPKNEHYFEACDVDTLFTDVKDLFVGNDVNFTNLECAITNSEHKIAKFGTHLKTGPKTAAVLKKLGVNLVGLSNNHVFDFGIEGITDTIRALDEQGLDYTGFGKDYEDSRRDYVVEKDGERVAFITVCEHEYSYALDDRMGSRPFDPFDTLIDIRRANETCDRVIVIYHGGKEHCAYPSPRVRKAAQAMVEQGADLVIGQHSHCICCYEEYKGGHILYGQGNFYFVGGRAHYGPEWHRCLAVKYDTKENKVEFVPITAYDDVGVKIASAEVADEIMSAFERRNEELQNGKWKDGWHEFCVKSTYYIDAIAAACVEGASERDNGVFGHYLDCEAHTDVWRELFPSYNLTNEK